MRIRSLTLKNYRGFEDATVDLDRPLTVLFGVNGSGKSSVLDACVYVLSRVFIEANPFGGLAGGPGVWGYTPADIDVRSGARELSLAGTLANGEITQTVVVNHPAPDRDPSIVNAAALRFAGAGPVLSVSYGASRAVAATEDAFAPAEHGKPENPSSAMFDSLAVGTLKFRSLFQWFKDREDVENELKVARQDLSLEDPQLSAVRRAIGGMLPGFSGLRIQRDPLHMVIRKGDALLAIDQLSDGEKVLLALTADLARRLAMTYPKLADPLQGEAVVLIDEIELHLHPDWQRRVLGALLGTFPNCQFIVTTHSPQVLSEVPNDAVTLVQDFQFFRPAAPTAGRDSNSILWEVLGVAARPQAVVAEIEAISALLDDGKVDEVRARLDALAERVTERDPDVARLRGLTDVVERIDADDHEGA